MATTELKFKFNKEPSRVDGNIHVMPNDNKHIETKDCFCTPKLDYKDEITSLEVWVHNDIRKAAVN